MVKRNLKGGKKSIVAAQNALAKLPPGYRKQKNLERKKAMGVISRDLVYHQELFLKLTGLREMAWRKVLLGGLKYAYLNGQTFITGEAWYEWITDQAEKQYEAFQERKAESAKREAESDSDGTEDEDEDEE